MTPQQMLKLHRSGLTINKIVELTGESRYRVHRAITAERWRQGEIVITEKCIRSMIAEGLTVRQMAERQMCCIGCISKKMKGYGIKLKRGNPNL